MLGEENETTEEHYKCHQHEGQNDEFSRARTQRVPQRKQALKVTRHLEDTNYSQRSEETQHHQKIEIEVLLRSEDEIQVERKDCQQVEPENVKLITGDFLFTRPLITGNILYTVSFKTLILEESVGLGTERQERELYYNPESVGECWRELTLTKKTELM